MKKIFLFAILLFQAAFIQAIEINAELFSYDEEKINQEFKQLSELEEIVKNNPAATIEEIFNLCPHFKQINNLGLITPYSIAEISAPGNFPSFWFAFAFSAVGTYFIYGAVAGPIATGIVYFSSDKDRIETKKALWGCVAGTLIGAGIKLVVVNL